MLEPGQFKIWSGPTAKKDFGELIAQNQGRGAQTGQTTAKVPYSSRYTGRNQTTKTFKNENSRNEPGNILNSWANPDSVNYSESDFLVPESYDSVSGLPDNIDYLDAEFTPEPAEKVEGWLTCLKIRHKLTQHNLTQKGTGTIPGHLFVFFHSRTHSICCFCSRTLQYVVFIPGRSRFLDQNGPKIFGYVNDRNV